MGFTSDVDPTTLHTPKTWAPCSLASRMAASGLPFLTLEMAMTTSVGRMIGLRYRN